MPPFWPRLVLLGLTWLVLVLQLPARGIPGCLLLATLYLAGYFVSQLAVPAVARSLARLAALGAAIGVMFLVGQHVSGLVLVLAAALLAGTLLVDHAIDTVIDKVSNPGAGWSVAAAVGGTALTSAALAVILVSKDTGRIEFALLALVLYLIVTATSRFHRTEVERRDGAERYGALLSEYRDLKRVAAGSADTARAEERISVARRLHDSVGQRLTSLLMQLEVERLGATSPEQVQRAGDLKRLAQLSLDETRDAVSALNEEELMGMPALFRLIHNLEVESAMQVEFTIGSGAMSVRLDREPAIALYRAVQEALTNAMRHGSSRRATVRLEAPGGRLVRFEVENENARANGADASQEQGAFRPGFGLSSMRERVQAAGGELEVISGAGTFLVRGSFQVRT